MDITILYTKNLTGQTGLKDVVCTPSVVSCEISVPFNAGATAVNYNSSVMSMKTPNRPEYTLRNGLLIWPNRGKPGSI